MMGLEDLISRAQVIDTTKLSGGQIKFGATVTVIDEDTAEKGDLPDRRRFRGRCEKGPRLDLIGTHPVTAALRRRGGC
jgi:hypothetical protein